MLIERRYALTKIAAGDYMFPSNDAQTIWRVSRYTDGPSFGIDAWPCDREFWGLWRWTQPFRPNSYVDTESWERWEMHTGLLKKRSDAIDAALRANLKAQEN